MERWPRCPLPQAARILCSACRERAARRAGFNDVFPLAALAAFHEDELEAMLCGMGEAWSVAMLADTIKFDHGRAPARPRTRGLRVPAACCAEAGAR